jgi:environmental stress-induced protein Ves
MVRLLTPNDYRSMPWKNGGGRTTELAVHPAGAGLDAFAWRVSIASVERDGPFSAFPGIDRTIVLLDGAGMRLSGAGQETALTTHFVPHGFRGDESVQCTLVAGPCRDFNAMFRRGRARGSVAVVRGCVGEFDPALFCLSYAAKGAHECTIARRSAHRLDEGHALVAAESVSDVQGGSVVVRPLADDAVALVVCVAYR